MCLPVNAPCRRALKSPPDRHTKESVHGRSCICKKLTARRSTPRRGGVSVVAVGCKGAIWHEHQYLHQNLSWSIDTYGHRIPHTLHTHSTHTLPTLSHFSDRGRRICLTPDVVTPDVEASTSCVFGPINPLPCPILGVCLCVCLHICEV